MVDQTDHWADYASPKLEVRACLEKGGQGVFALRPIRKGELLTLWSGRIVPAEELAGFSELERRYSIQVEEGHYLVSVGGPGVTDYMNHSCEPNAGLDGQIALVAMRNIAAGEEVTFDYAMSDGSPYDEFECGCGAAACRGRITGDDWRLADLQARYRGYFSPYLERRIERLEVVAEMGIAVRAPKLVSVSDARDDLPTPASMRSAKRLNRGSRSRERPSPDPPPSAAPH